MVLLPGRNSGQAGSPRSDIDRRPAFTCLTKFMGLQELIFSSPQAVTTPGGAAACCCGPAGTCCVAATKAPTSNSAGDSTGSSKAPEVQAMVVGIVLVFAAVILAFFTFACLARRRRRAAARLDQARSHVPPDAPPPPPGVQLKPIDTHDPSADQEGQTRECPVCLQEFTQNQDWLLLPCEHGLCRTCYGSLLAVDQNRITNCPLCRLPLLEPIAADQTQQVEGLEEGRLTAEGRPPLQHAPPPRRPRPQVVTFGYR